MDGRAERPRAHAVDPDPVAGVLDRRHLGQLDHRRLGGAVGRGVRPRREPGDRRGEHDRARPLRAHDRHRGPDAVDRTEHVDPEGPLPVLGGQVVDAAVGRQHAGVADQHVEAAEALDRPRDHGLDLGEVAHVGQQRLDRPPRRRRGRPTVASSDGALTSLSTRSVPGSPASRRDTAAPSAPPAPSDGDDPSRFGLGGHTSRYPPSTLSTVPVTNAEASEARNW